MYLLFIQYILSRIFFHILRKKYIFSCFFSYHGRKLTPACRGFDEGLGLCPHWASVPQRGGEKRHGSRRRHHFWTGGSFAPIHIESIHTHFAHWRKGLEKQQRLNLFSIMFQYEDFFNYHPKKFIFWGSRNTSLLKLRMILF